MLSAPSSESMCMSQSVMIDNQLEYLVDHTSLTRFVIHSPLVGHLLCVWYSSKTREGLQERAHPSTSLHSRRSNTILSASSYESICMSQSVMIDDQLEHLVDYSSLTRLVIHPPLVGYLVCVRVAHPRRLINNSQSPQHSTSSNHSPCCRNVRAHEVTVSCVVSITTSYQSPLPPCRVGNKLLSIWGQVNLGLGWLVGAYYSNSIHGGAVLTILFTKPRRYAHNAQRGSVPGVQDDNFASEPGEIMKVAMQLCTPLLVGL